MALFLIVGQAHFVINNIFEGFIWFFLPVALVVTNDIFAYLCGITFGRTPLIKISPKKTWEGFLGAWFFTLLWGVGLTYVMSQYKYFTCPVNVCHALSGITYMLTKYRILEPTCGQDWNARRTRSSLPRPIPFPSSLLVYLFPTSTPSSLSNFTSSFSPHLRLGSRRSVASSPRDLSEPSRLRILATAFLDTAV